LTRACLTSFSVTEIGEGMAQLELLATSIWCALSASSPFNILVPSHVINSYVRNVVEKLHFGLLALS
jgi:hypothetical protein